MKLTDEQQALLTLAEGVGLQVREISSDASTGRVNRRLVRALAEFGLLGRIFRDDHVPAMDLCLIRQGLARTNTEAETALAVQGLGTYPIVQSGPEELVQRWVPRVASGQAIAAFALTEPEAGSDAASLALRAERDGDGFRLTGEKTFISNAPDADLYTVFARTTADAGARGVTAFAVPGDSPGLSGSSLSLLSPHPLGTLTFDGVPVGADHVLGEVDRGFRVAMRTLDLFRPSVGAFAVGMAEAALRAATAYATQRVAFDRPIVEFQAVSHQLADMVTKTEAAKLLVYSAAEAYDRGERVTGQAAMAKLYATETAQFVVDAAIQIHGARALVIDHPLAHLYQDVRAPRIYEGTSEIQRTVIARELVAGRLGPDVATEAGTDQPA